MALRFWVGGTGTWDQTSTTHWSTGTGGATGASVPTASDDVIFDANSGAGTCTISLSAPMNSLATSGSSLHTISAVGINLTIGSATAGNGNIALDLSGLTGFTPGGLISFISTSVTVQTVNFGGFSGTNVTFNGTGGSWQLTNALNTSVTGSVTLTTGTLNTNGQTCSWGLFVFTGSAIRVLTLGASLIAMTGTGTVWSATATGATLNAGTSTITVSDTSSTTKTFSPNTLTYNNLTIAGGGTGSVTIFSTVTFNTLTIGAPKTIIMANSTTKTVTSFVARGSSGNVITISSVTAGTAWTLSKSSGTVQADWLSLKDSTASGGATFYAGANSTSVSGNTGWTFTAVPGTAQTATLTSAGTFGPTSTLKALAAALTSTGAIQRAMARAFAAAASFSGTIPRGIVRALSAALGATGTLAKRTGRPLSASVASVASVVRSTGRALAASVGNTGTITRGTTRALAASTAPAGTITRRTARGLSAVLTTAGAAGKPLKSSVVGVLSFAGSLVGDYRARFVPRAVGLIASIFRGGRSSPTSTPGNSRPTQTDGEV